MSQSEASTFLRVRLNLLTQSQWHAKTRIFPPIDILYVVFLPSPGVQCIAFLYPRPVLCIPPIHVLCYVCICPSFRRPVKCSRPSLSCPLLVRQPSPSLSPAATTTAPGRAARISFVGDKNGAHDRRAVTRTGRRQRFLLQD